MAHTGEIDIVIIMNLNQQGACPLEELIRRLPRYGWNQVFSAVDRLSRNGQLELTRLAPFDYLVSPGSHHSSCRIQELREVSDGRLKP